MSPMTKSFAEVVQEKLEGAYPSFGDGKDYKPEIGFQRTIPHRNSDPRLAYTEWEFLVQVCGPGTLARKASVLESYVDHVRTTTDLRPRIGRLTGGTVRLFFRDPPLPSA